MSRKIKFIVVGAAASLLVSACGGSASEDPTKAAEVTFATFRSATVSLPEQIAVEKGLFDKYGIAAKVTPVASGPEMVAAVLSNTAQVTGAPTTVLWPAQAKGECFQYLTAGQGSMSNIIARPGVKLPNEGAGYPQALKDLEGKKFGVVVRGGNTETQIRTLLEDAGVDPDSVQYISVGGSAARMAALEAKEIDFTWSAPPMEQVMKPGSFTKVVQLVGEENPLTDVRQTATAVTCDFAEKNPEVVQDICRALWDSYDYINDEKNRDEVIETFQNMMGLTSEEAQGVWDEQKATFSGPELSEELWNKQKDFLPDELADALPDYNKYVDSCATQDPR